MSIFEWITIITFGSLCGIFCGLAIYSLGKQQTPTHKEMMEWDFRGCEQMREAEWPEKEIAELMRRPGNYYDKDYK